MTDKKKKNFVKPKLIKFDKPLDKVTLCGCGSARGDHIGLSLFKFFR